MSHSDSNPTIQRLRRQRTILLSIVAAFALGLLVGAVADRVDQLKCAKLEVASDPTKSAVVIDEGSMQLSRAGSHKTMIDGDEITLTLLPDGNEDPRIIREISIGFDKKTKRPRMTARETDERTLRSKELWRVE
jgi:hypothetical protein